jgi:enterochelin esterase-like enzyme
MATTVPPPTHSHGTWGNRKKQQHTAATAATTTFHSDAYKNAGYNKKSQQYATDTAAAALFHSGAYHCALHSTAINPNTGHTVEYHELRVCTDGDKWINSCADEIGRLCNGRTNANGKLIASTNTLFFIPIAAKLKKKNNDVSVSWSVETKWTTPEPSAPKLPTSPRQRSY